MGECKRRVKSLDTGGWIQTRPRQLAKVQPSDGTDVYARLAQASEPQLICVEKRAESNERRERAMAARNQKAEWQEWFVDLLLLTSAKPRIVTVIECICPRVALLECRGRRGST